jgi:hypothetical protein
MMSDLLAGRICSPEGAAVLVSGALVIMVRQEHAET